MADFLDNVDKTQSVIPIAMSFDLSGLTRDQPVQASIAGEDLRDIAQIAHLNILNADKIEVETHSESLVPIGVGLSHGPNPETEAAIGTGESFVDVDAADAVREDGTVELDAVGTSTWFNPEAETNPLDVYHHVGIGARTPATTLHLIPSEAELAVEKEIVDKGLTPTWSDIGPGNITTGTKEAEYDGEVRMLVPEKDAAGTPNGVYRLLHHNKGRLDNKFLDGRYSEAKLR